MNDVKGCLATQEVSLRKLSVSDASTVYGLLPIDRQRSSGWRNVFPSDARAACSSVFVDSRAFDRNRKKESRSLRKQMFQVVCWFSSGLDEDSFR